MIKDFRLYELIGAERGFFNKSVLILIFCFPVFSLSIRHWLSGIFGLLILLSLVAIAKQGQKLFTEEKVLLCLLGLVIASFVLSATLNEWSVNSIRRIGNVSKYLLFIPFYLLIRRFHAAPYLLLLGILLASIVLGLQAVYDITTTPQQTAWGIYGPIVYGDLSILYFSILLVIFFIDRYYFTFTPMLGVAILFAIVAGILSGSRNAWFAAVIAAVSIPLLSHKFTRHKYGGWILIPLIIIAVIVLATYKPLQERLLLVYTQTVTFMQAGAPRDISLTGNAIGIRLEQWRSALQIYKESPLFGFGGGNAAKQVNKFVKKGLAHPDLYNPDSEINIGGIHSTYFETLLNEGLVGLTILLIFLFYPLYVFTKNHKREPLLSAIGIVFVCNYFIFGLTENPFVHDNFTSVYLVFLAILFSAIVRSQHAAPDSFRHAAT